MAMSTIPTPASVDDIVPTFCDLKDPTSCTFSVDPAGKADITIHRRTGTHHGATLRILGHAAEYLVDSRKFLTSAGKADAEAVYILMRLSREIFEEYAEGVAVGRRLHDWVMDRMVRRYD